METRKIQAVEVIDTFFPTLDGVIETVHNYATYLNKQAPTAVVFPQQRQEYDYSKLGYETIMVRDLKLPIKEYTLPDPTLSDQLRKTLDDRHIDLIHIHSPFLLGHFAVAYAKHKKIPVVATFHSKYYDDAFNVTGSTLIAKAAAKNVVNLYKQCDSVWACSAGTAETLRSYGYKGDIFVMDNGTSFDIPKEKRRDLADRAKRILTLPEGKHNILFVGHLIKHKNLKLVLDAFRLLTKDSDDYRLLIVGEGYDGDEIRAYADSLSFSKDQVRFLGKISDRNLLAGVFLNSELFFFPSVYDNSPLVVREAASLGVPSLLTEGSNAAEAVRKDISGFTAKEDCTEMAKEIRRIFGDPDLLRRVSLEAERSIPKTWEQIVEQVKEQYALIIDAYQKKRAERYRRKKRVGIEVSVPKEP